jgi:hypothetical protein
MKRCKFSYRTNVILYYLLPNHVDAVAPTTRPLTAVVHRPSS